MRKHLVGILSLVAALAFVTGPVTAQSVPSGFLVENVVTSGLDAPHCLGVDALGRLFVGERAGEVHIVVNGVRTSIGTVPNVQTGSERGLLSVVTDPNFTSNGYLYVWCSRTTSGNMEVLRYTCTGQLNNASSGAVSFSSATERVIVNSAPDSAFNHNGGTLIFSPIDDMLLLSIGDDASCGSAQSANTLAGVLVRMDVSGVPAGPSATPPSFASLDPGDNPSSGSGTASAIVMDIGLRNPWRMTHDVITGDLYIADVGQNAVEEFDQRLYTNTASRINFGWPYKEGTSFFGCGGFNGNPGGLTDPIVEVTHASGWFSAFAGCFYRNQTGASQTFGPAYDRIWLYGDYFSGQLRALMDNGNGTWSPLPAVPGQPSATNWGTGFAGISQAILHQDGSIYFTQHAGPNNFGAGTLKRIRPMGPIDVVTVTAGDDQVGLANETFLSPVEVRVTGSQSGLPMPGINVTFNVTNGSVVGSPNAMTDANGFASAVVAAANGGPVTVNATTGNMGSGTATLFARELTVTFTRIPNIADIIVTNFTNTSQLANVPLVFALSLDTVPIVPTPIGDICVDIFNGVDTVIFEDAFSGLSSNTVPPFGTPGRTANYFGPANIIPPGTYRFQYFWDDVTTLNSVAGLLPFRIGVSNCAFMVAP